MHQAGQHGFGLAAQRQHISAIAHGDKAFLPGILKLGLFEQGLEAVLQFPLQSADLPAQHLQLAAGAVRHTAVLLEAGLQATAQFITRLEALQQR